MNIGEFLSSDLIVGILFLVMFLFMMRRIRKRPELVKLEWDLAYDYVTEPRNSENRDFVETFQAQHPPHGEDIHLIRLAFLNKGTRKVTPDDFQHPVTVTFPEGTEILSAVFNDANKTPALEDHITSVTDNKLNIDPFSIEPDGALVFNIVVKGAAEPDDLDSALAEQEDLRRLGLNFRYLKKKK